MVTSNALQQPLFAVGISVTSIDVAFIYTEKDHLHEMMYACLHIYSFPCYDKNIERQFLKYIM